MTKKIQIAVDGPVSSGKTTIGSLAAARLHYLFVDTGLMYRAVAWKINKASAEKDHWIGIAEGCRFQWSGNNASPSILLDGQDITAELSLPDISLLSSQVAADPGIRKILVGLQQEMARGGGVVMVGRDIGQVVLPGAELKIFLTASVEARALRRYQELRQKGIAASLDQVTIDLIGRDNRDTTRECSPLQRAQEAVLLDSTQMTIEEVVDCMVSMAKVKEGCT